MNKLAIIGCGNLGSSIARLLVINGYGNNLTISDKNSNVDIIKSGLYNLPTYENIEKSDTIFISVKPNVIPDILNDIRSYGDENKLIISTAAGVSIDYIQKKLNSDNYPIIRMMPNLSISMTKGSITYFPNKNVNVNLIHDMKTILNGPFIYQVNNEKLIDVSTILTASMPAYISHIAESCIKFGIDNGFEKQESIDLFVSTLNGTVDMLKQNSTTDIIKKVATENGVTRQGLNNMDLKDINKIIIESMNISYNHLNSIKKLLD